MNKREWQQIKQLFQQALALPDAERQAFVDGQTSLTPALKNTLLVMLNEHTTPQADDPDAIVNAAAEELIQDQAILHSGDHIEQFVVQSLIDEGGMGRVYLAERQQADFEQKVAIKVVHSQHITPAQAARFIRERQILASLKHKNIAALIGGGQTDGGHPYIIMEYVAGLPITDYCARHKLDVNAILQLFQQVLSAIAYSHKNLIIHRDIKPSNVMVTASGDVKLLDFGIAKLLDDNVAENMRTKATQQTSLSARVLSISSASPEQISGEPVTTATDVYGLGTLLTQMLTDQPVFDGSTLSVRELESCILDTDPEKISSRVQKSTNPQVRKRLQQISRDLDTVVQHALNKQPEQRYQTAAQLAEDVRRVQHNYPILAQPPRRRDVFAKFVQRNKASSALTALVIAGLLVSSGIIWQQSLRIQHERDKALEQAFIARQTSDYMAGMFSTADPNISSGEVFTAKMLLDQAKDSIQVLNAAPQIKLELLITLISSYLGIGEYDTTDVLIGQAKAQLPKVDDQKRKRQFEVMLNSEQGTLLNNLGKYDQALTLYQLQIEGLNDIAPSADFDKRLYEILAQYGAAVSLGYSGKDKQSIAYYQRAYDLAKGTRHEPEYASTTLFGLGSAARHTSDFEQSVTYLKRGIAAAKAYKSAPTLELASGLNQLASTLHRLERFDEALDYALEGLIIRQTLHQKPHIEIGASMGIVSRIYLAQGRFEEALDYRQQMLKLLQNTLGVDHPFYAAVLGVAGRLSLRLGDFHGAEQYLQDALRKLNALYPDGHSHMLSPLFTLSELNLRQGNPAQAQRYNQQAIDIAERDLSEKHHQRATALIMQAIVRTKQFPQDNVQALIDQAIADFAQTYPESSNRYQKLVELIAELQAL